MQDFETLYIGGAKLAVVRRGLPSAGATDPEFLRPLRNHVLGGAPDSMEFVVAPFPKLLRTSARSLPIAETGRCGAHLVLRDREGSLNGRDDA